MPAQKNFRLFAVDFQQLGDFDDHDRHQRQANDDFPVFKIDRDHFEERIDAWDEEDSQHHTDIDEGRSDQGFVDEEGGKNTAFIGMDVVGMDQLAEGQDTEGHGTAQFQGSSILRIGSV